MNNNMECTFAVFYSPASPCNVSNGTKSVTYLRDSRRYKGAAAADVMILCERFGSGKH